eukprot:GHVU01019332.1.p2 GENE.GHVU01019332.1~~GHVU01019332.1.p2  ORF type:complete len:127 (-),score=19.20 GHVU01019332.1:442-822(-)
MELAEVGMYLTPVGMMHGAPVSVGTFIWKQLIMVTIGNMFGAGVMVAMTLYWLSGPGLDKIEAERAQRAAVGANKRHNSIGMGESVRGSLLMHQLHVKQQLHDREAVKEAVREELEMAPRNSDDHV